MLNAFLSLDEEERASAWEGYLNAFFTSKRERRKSFATKGAISACADLPDIMQAECERLERVCERLKAVNLSAAPRRCCDWPARFLSTTSATRPSAACFDYDDLILLSRNLLQRAEVVPWCSSSSTAESTTC